MRKLILLKGRRTKPTACDPIFTPLRQNIKLLMSRIQLQNSDLILYGDLIVGKIIIFNEVVL